MSLLFLWQFIWKGLHNICLFWRWRSHAVSKSKSLFFSNKPLIAFSSLSFISFFFFFPPRFLRCTTETASDYVEFSNYRTVDRKIPRHCGLKVPKTIESDADFFRVTFKSNDRFDGTGFEAFYQFRTQPGTSIISNFSFVFVN